MAKLPFRCTCEPDRLEATLVALGPDESAAILAEEGEIRVRWVFCATRWRKAGLEREWERMSPVDAGPAGH